MGGLVGFLLGYCVGAMDGPERLARLFQSTQEIVNSPELRALRSRLAKLAQQMLGDLPNGGLRNGLDPVSAPEIWKAISESPEFRALLATGASLIQGWLSNLDPHDRSDGPASQQ
jgi:hypothetical protein